MDDSSTIFKELVDQALSSPSGDNCQPWRFVSNGPRLKIVLDRERADHPLNSGGIASALALGCLIESISILARQRGLQIQVEHHDALDSVENCWAILELLPQAQKDLSPDPLADFLDLRSTDRRLFEKGNIPWEKIKQATRQQKENSPAQIHGVDVISPELKNYILESEKFLFDHSGIIPKILQWTRMTTSDVLRTRDGLSLKNMGVRPIEVPGLKLLKMVPSLHKVFKGTMIRQHVERVRGQLDSSAGLLCVSLPGDRKDLAPDAGRLMFRVWLELTRCGFGVQPVSIPSTLVFLAQAGLLDDSVSQKWKEHFASGVSIMSEAFKLAPKEVPVWMIRTGRSSLLPAALRTLRRPVEDVFSVVENKSETGQQIHEQALRVC